MGARKKNLSLLTVVVIAGISTLVRLCLFNALSVLASGGPCDGMANTGTVCVTAQLVGGGGLPTGATASLSSSSSCGPANTFFALPNDAGPESGQVCTGDLSNAVLNFSSFSVGGTEYVYQDMYESQGVNFHVGSNPAWCSGFTPTTGCWLDMNNGSAVSIVVEYKAVVQATGPTWLMYLSNDSSATSLTTSTNMDSCNNPNPAYSTAPSGRSFSGIYQAQAGYGYYSFICSTNSSPLNTTIAMGPPPGQQTFKMYPQDYYSSQHLDCSALTSCKVVNQPSDGNTVSIYVQYDDPPTDIHGQFQWSKVQASGGDNVTYYATMQSGINTLNNTVMEVFMPYNAVSASDINALNLSATYYDGTGNSTTITSGCITGNTYMIGKPTIPDPAANGQYQCIYYNQADNHASPNAYMLDQLAAPPSGNPGPKSAPYSPRMVFVQFDQLPAYAKVTVVFTIQIKTPVNVALYPRINTGDPTQSWCQDSTSWQNEANNNSDCQVNVDNVAPNFGGGCTPTPSSPCKLTSPPNGELALSSIFRTASAWNSDPYYASSQGQPPFSGWSYVSSVIPLNNVPGLTLSDSIAGTKPSAAFATGALDAFYLGITNASGPSTRNYLFSDPFSTLSEPSGSRFDFQSSAAESGSSDILKSPPGNNPCSSNTSGCDVLWGMNDQNPTISILTKLFAKTGDTLSNIATMYWNDYSVYPAVTRAIQGKLLRQATSAAASPFLTTAQSDVHAGGGVSNLTNCPVNGLGGDSGAIYTNPNGSSQYALSQGKGTSIPGLTSNSNIGSGQTLTLGSGGGSPGVTYSLVCRPDLVAAASSIKVSHTPFTDLMQGTQQNSYNTKVVTGATGPGNVFTLDPAGAPIYGRWTLYVSGDLYIKSNVINASAGGISTLPSFGVIVSGNIYVDPGVTELDGFYYAQQRSVGGAGNINTCATDVAGSITTLGNNGGDLQAPQCQTKLTINGFMMANNFNFYRTTANSPAETTILLSQLFLRTPPAMSDLSTSLQGSTFNGELAPRY